MEEYLEKDYIVDKSNIKTYKAIIENNNFTNTGTYKNFNLIYGSKSSGKTHLATIWARKNNAIKIRLDDKNLSEFLNINKTKTNYFLIDDIELFDFSRAFHIFNLINECGKFCLITTTKYPFDSNLHDLNSRINSIKSFKLEYLNHDSIYLFLKRQFISKSISFTDNALKYLSYRIPREINKIKKIIDFLDNKSLQNQAKITTFFVQNLIHEIQNINNISENDITEK